MKEGKEYGSTLTNLRYLPNCSSGNSGDYPRGLSVYIYPSASGNPKIITPTSSISGSIFTYDLQGTQQGVALCLHVGRKILHLVIEWNLFFFFRTHALI